MSDCPCDEIPSRDLDIPAGLDSLPRQSIAFPEARLQLLRHVSKSVPLEEWSARGERDFGVMWLEMWAYISDVVGFYDERIANETYIRTAALRPSLRRILDLLGYVPAPGVAGEAMVAVIAEGKKARLLSPGIAVRSDAFGDESPQVFESDAPEFTHPLKNTWELGPVPVVAASGKNSSELIFESEGFGLAEDRLVLISWSGNQRARRVRSVKPFEGVDGNTYVRVVLDTALTISESVDLADVKVQIPTVRAVVADDDDAVQEKRGKLDSLYRQLREQDPILWTASDGPPCTRLTLS